MPLNPPPKAKKWGQADEDILYELLKYDEIDIGDTSLATIERIRWAHFQHRSVLGACWGTEELVGMNVLEKKLRDVR